MTFPWSELALFMVAIALLALYGLTVSGHFPAEVRAPALRSTTGAATLWTTLVAAGVAAIITIAAALRALPWSAIIIGGGAMLLFAPLLLRPLPDRFVNGYAALVGFAGGAVLAALILWAAT
jgi:hypothetical protein